MVTRYREAREDGVEEELEGEYVKYEDWEEADEDHSYWYNQYVTLFNHYQKLLAKRSEGEDAQC